ncbi:MBL fold metallo-hydrolase [Cellulomonas edaphi]|uniref:MBL fold metallo-hydrolase n=1 Tax=Cellulomonas edaphi TaxID=3053468 RepID=A0ABT7S923_9CELL|nr:MBL fold metallo-hydrolase [Cellulomons edaphi]MDM7832086.1 MBL fold metallo-hydrolase [Cellulomons edaphi]
MTSNQPITATLVGGPTLALSYGGLAFLTDPTFDEPGEYAGGITLRKLVGPSVSADELGPIDVVLLSHDQHADNLDTSGRALLADVPLVLSTQEAAARVPGVRGLAPWERTELADEVVVTAVPARHGPQGAEPLSGSVTGFVLEGPGLPTVYVAGDNASLDVVDAVARRFPTIGIAVLFVGGANVGRFGDEPVTLDAARASAAADLLAGATIVPVHHTDWAHFVEPLSAVVERFAAGGRSERLTVLERGVPTALQPR